MGDEKVRRVLKNFGLTKKETDIYFFLAKHGVQRSGEIAKRTRTHRAEVYRILKRLQTKGLVQPTLESPTRFTTVPFETVIDSFIKTKREEAASLESTKKDLLEDWKIISRHEPEPQLERFVVIEGRHKIYPKILQMVQETKSRLSAVSTVAGLLRADQFGLFDAVFGNPLKSKIKFRFLTELSRQNLDAAKALLKRIPATGFDFKGRNPELGLQLSPRMVIRDEDEILFFITSKNASLSGQNDVCLWTNCKALVDSFNTVFEDLWRNSTDLKKKIVEVETGKPAQKTQVISNAETASKKYDDILRSAKKEIIVLTSEDGLLVFRKKMKRLKEWTQRGVSVRIMAPITSENLEAAQELLKCCEVRHVPIGYLGTTVIDGQHLFQFKNPPPEEESLLLMSYFENIFYTNDLAYVEKTKNMLDAIWNSSFSPSAITLDSILKPPIQPVALPDEGYVFSRPESPYKKISHYVKEKHGVITEEDVLNKIINAKKYPAKNWPKDILRNYGSNGITIIHPPKHFCLPDMMIWVLHYDKQSSFVATDLLLIYLWLETPKGNAYVPVAIVTDNPRYVKILKAIYAGTPAGQNVQLIKKDGFQVRVHSNIIFAGWTVPIQLFQSYTLPPSCILFEGYTEVKTGVMDYQLPSGVNIIAEYNGLDAFVTFFHPSSKYSGPGTDGVMSRDLIVTIISPCTAKP